MTADSWEHRTGQIETVLSYFGTTCSITIERADGATVYIQARRLADGLELEAVGNGFLPSYAQLSPADIETMAGLGWDVPPSAGDGDKGVVEGGENFARLVRDAEDLHEIALALAATLRQVYRVEVADTWLVYPPEFGEGTATASDLEAVDAAEIGLASGVPDLDASEGGPAPSTNPAIDSDLHSVAAQATGDEGSVTGFSPYVQEQIGWYVYLLRDPRDGEVFYVGKGKGNRVFAHAQDALAPGNETADSLKLDRLRQIHAAGLRVQTEIVRHRISSESVAYTVEAAVIDTFRALGHPLTNKVGGHYGLYGWASTGTVASIYDAPPLPATDEPLLLLKLSKLWTPAMSDAELFGATRGWWTVGQRALRARYALAVSRGVTRAAFSIEYWRERVPTDRDYSADDNGRRLGFWGAPAPKLDHLVNKSIARVPQPSGGSFVYLNVDPKAPAVVPLYRGASAYEIAAQELNY